MASNLHRTTDLPAHGRSFSKTKKRRKSSRHQNTRHKRVAILLATKQGERFLPATTAVVHEPDTSNRTLWVSDDTSTDSSVKLIEQFQELVGEERVRLGIGPAADTPQIFYHLPAILILMQIIFPIRIKMIFGKPTNWLVRSKGSRHFPMMCRRCIVLACGSLTK